MAGSLELRLLSDIQKAVCCAAKEQTPSATFFLPAIVDASGDSVAATGTSIEVENFDDAYWLLVTDGTHSFLVRPGGSKALAFGASFAWGTLTLYAVTGPDALTPVIPSATVYAQVTVLSQS